MVAATPISPGESKLILSDSEEALPGLGPQIASSCMLHVYAGKVPLLPGLQDAGAI